MTTTRNLYQILDHPQKQKSHSFQVREFILFQSRLTPQGATHIPLRSFPLTAE